jgi:anti-sigma factor RsiW
MTMTLNPIKRHRDRCRDTRAHLSEYLDGELDERAAARVERHVRWCPNCGRMLANLSRTIGALRALRDLPTPADKASREPR